MRNMKEIKEEIFARSRRRIKKRRAILVTVITCCLCVAIGVTVWINNFYVQYVPQDNAAAEGMYETDGDYVANDREMSQVSEKIVNVSYDGNNWTETDKIVEITDVISLIISQEDISADDENFEYKSQNSLADTAQNSLVIITESGARVEYIIADYSIADVSNGIVYTVTQDQKNLLDKALK